jgi:valyl-tRNA synthetase
LWILSRLAHTIETVDKAFENYEFSIATQSCYSFWLYDLCDNYLECLKPVFQSGDEERKTIARRVLYTCLDLGLRLLSPFMPFITEELFQRLPRSNEEISSICVAPFPGESDIA